MTAVVLLVDGLLTLVAGTAVAGTVSLTLRCAERLLLAAVAGLLLGTLGTYFLSVLFGLSAMAVLLGPVVVIAGVVVAVFAGASNPVPVWRETLPHGFHTLRRGGVGLVVVGVVALVAFWPVFSHTTWIASDGSLQAGFPTVWADWSQHFTTEASFAVSGNLPPHNPIFSGTTLLYPFLPDFHSATLVTLGLDPGTALALPGELLAGLICVGIVLLGQRLGCRLSVGVIAIFICFLGGGLGFTRVLSDACVRQQAHGVPVADYSVATEAATGCTLRQLATNPAAVITSLASVPAVVMAQPRNYDGLLTPAASMPAANLQWNTPLEDWWLPQRTLLYGFAAVLTVLTLVVTALQQRARTLSSWVVAGLLSGLLPLYHVQSLIALGLGLAALAAWHWRRWRRWATFLGVTALVAAPRMIQIMLGPHGNAIDNNQYPFVQPGWYAFADPTTGTPTPLPPLDPYSSHSLVIQVVGDIVLCLRPLISVSWWEFWITNLGPAVPLCAAVMLLAAVARWGRGHYGERARALLNLFPGDLLGLLLSFGTVFLLANAVVFQSWAWDNTKLFLYWYLIAAFVIGWVAVELWRRGLRALHAAWMPVLGVLLVAVPLASGVLAVIRMLPATPEDIRANVVGPFTLVSAEDRAMALALAAQTPSDSVFVTTTNPNDPISVITGRSTVMGYHGWLWSYGIDDVQRQQDVSTIYHGCGQTPITSPSCPVAALLQEYHVSYVEIGPATYVQGMDPGWWSRQQLPVAASSSTTQVYDVRTLVQ